MNQASAIEVVNAKGLTVSSLSYREAEAAARKNRCMYLYDAGNGNVGRATWQEDRSRVFHDVTRDGRIWFF